VDVLVKLLKENARESEETLAKMLNTTVADIRERIAALEAVGIIRGYRAVVNTDIIEENNDVQAVIELRVRPEREGGFDPIARRISAFPEVISMFLVSGAYDLLLVVRGRSLQEVANFVSGRLAPIDGVLSTATHFLLKTYKDQEVLMDENEYDQRLPVVP